MIPTATSTKFYQQRSFVALCEFRRWFANILFDTSNYEPLVSLTMEKTGEIPFNIRLRQLNEAEECVCNVMQMAADTCAELQHLPFADTGKLHNTADEILANLQRIRAIVVENLEAIRPIEVQKQVAGSETDIKLLQDALRRLE